MSFEDLLPGARKPVEVMQAYRQRNYKKPDDRTTTAAIRVLTVAGFDSGEIHRLLEYSYDLTQAQVIAKAKYAKAMQLQGLDVSKRGRIDED